MCVREPDGQREGWSIEVVGVLVRHQDQVCLVGQTRRVDRRLQVRPTGIGVARVERAGEVGAVGRRRVQRLLQVHPEVHHVQEELQRPLVLLIPAGRAEG